MSEALERLNFSDLERSVGAFSRFFSRMPADPAAAMHGTVSHMHSLCRELAELPRVLWRSPEVQQLLTPAIAVQARSPFVRRLRDWPRGYPGDFETVEMLVRGANVPTNSDAGEWVDWYALNTAIAQQHRNKIWWQYLRMRDAKPGRILSVGCGGGADFNIAPHHFSCSEVVLLDLDDEALMLARGRLERYCQVHTISCDVRRGIRRAHHHGPFDLVVCGGLFDYLDDKTATFLLRELRERAVKLHGAVIFTNIARDNPYRVWMETIANWRLIHRTEGDIRLLVETAGFDPSGLTIRKDGTGLTHLAEAGC